MSTSTCESCEDTTTDCEDGCGSCDVKLTSLTCATHDGLALTCIGVLPGDNLEAIITKINTAYCDLTTNLVLPSDGTGVEAVSFTSTTATSGLAGESGESDTYTLWADVLFVTAIGTFTVLNGADGVGVDHISFTSTTATSTLAGESGETDTYTQWADATELISLGTYTILNGVTIDNVTFTSSTSTSGLAGELDGLDTYTVWEDSGLTSALGTFVVKQAETNSSIYDSDWLGMSIHGGVFGLPSITTGYTVPKIRVVGRTVYIEGQFLVPLEDNLAALAADASTYEGALAASNDVYQGLDGGFAVPATGHAILSQSPTLPSDLYPTTPVRVASNQIISRLVRSDPSAFVSLNVMLTSYLPKIEFTVDSKVWIHSLQSIEYGAGVITGLQVVPFYQGLITRVVAGDDAPDYSSYLNSYNGATDQRLSPTTGNQYPSTFDGSLVDGLGGFLVPFSFSYPIGSTVTQAQIIAAVATL